MANAAVNLPGVKIKRVINGPNTGNVKYFWAAVNSAKGRYKPPLRMT